jgi:hypothetical protein
VCDANWPWRCSRSRRSLRSSGCRRPECGCFSTSVYRSGSGVASLGWLFPRSQTRAGAGAATATSCGAFGGVHACGDR